MENYLNLQCKYYVCGDGESFRYSARLTKYLYTYNVSNTFIFLWRVKTKHLNTYDVSIVRVAGFCPFSGSPTPQRRNIYKEILQCKYKFQDDKNLHCKNNRVGRFAARKNNFRKGLFSHLHLQRQISRRAWSDGCLPSWERNDLQGDRTTSQQERTHDMDHQ